MQTFSLRIWTWILESTSNDDNRYATDSVLKITQNQRLPALNCLFQMYGIVQQDHKNNSKETTAQYM